LRVPGAKGVEPTGALRWLGEVGGFEESERRVWPARTDSEHLPIVVYGAGELGRRVTGVLIEDGTRPVVILDLDSRLWGTSVAGVPVASPRAVGDFVSGGFASVVAVWNPNGHRYAETAEMLEALGSVSTVPFHLVGSRLPGICPHFCHADPSTIEGALARIKTAYALLYDEASRVTFRQEIAWRAGFVGVADRAPVEGQYLLDGLYERLDTEVFVDCGAYDGDTLLAFLQRWPCFAAYHAYEPDPQNVSSLRRRVQELAGDVRGRIVVREAATSDIEGEVCFSPQGDGGCVTCDGSLVVPAVRLDDEAISPPPTFIKADVEGAEAASVRGAAGVIAGERPVLALCAYHRPDDLWELPILCHELLPHARLHLRMHGQDGWETVLYAVPEERAASGGG
jgi:FkbM family methyltransferase